MNWLLKLLALIVQWCTGRRAIAQAEQRAATAEAKDAQDEQIVHATEVRHDVEQAVERLPEAPTVKVADAPAGSASARLRDKWSRD